MKMKQYRPMWPYLGILACLFVLTVTAPRSWERPAGHDDPAESQVAESESTEPLADDEPTPVWATAAVHAPAARSAAVDTSGIEPTPVWATAAMSASTGRIASDAPEITPAPRPAGATEVADVERYAPAPPLAVRMQGDNGPASLPPAPPKTRLPIRNPQPVPSLVSVREQQDPEWAVPQRLLEQLEELALADEAAPWATDVLGRVQRLISLPCGSDEAPAIVRTLHDAEQQIDVVIDGVDQPALRTKLLRARHALARRLDVWQSILAADGSPRFALRLGPPGISIGRQRFPGAAALDPAKNRWVTEGVDVRRLLSHVEAYEQTGRSSDARLVAERTRILAAASNPGARQVAENLDRHYRNANVRVAVTADLVNRWLPKPKPVDDEIYDTIIGADVEGCSRTTTDLSVRLVPDPRMVRLELQATGLVSTDTQSTSGPATFHSLGETAYLAGKPITIGPDGVRVGPASASAFSDSDLVAMDTDYDSVPLVGSLVRNIARSQHSQSLGQAMRETEDRVSARVRQRVDAEANQQIAKARDRFQQKVLAPLEHLALQPTPLDMHTTDKRIIARVRLAGQHQLGGHTPRPRAPSDSLASVQVHHSALNNAAASLGLNGETFALPELYQRLSERLKRKIEMPDDLPERVSVTFAEQDAVQFHCDGGEIAVELTISELRQPRRHYRDFKVRAFYRLESVGLQTQLVRKKPIQLEGEQLNTGAQIVLRGIFSKVFSRNRSPQLIDAKLAADPRLAGLGVTQLVVDDGWIGLAVGPPNRLIGHRRSATVPSANQQR